MVSLGHRCYLQTFLVAVSGGCAAAVAGFSLRWLLLLQSTGSAHGLQQLGLACSRTWAQQLWCTGLSCLRHVESFWTRDLSDVPCIGRWTPIHCTTREVLNFYFRTAFFGEGGRTVLGLPCRAQAFPSYGPRGFLQLQCTGRVALCIWGLNSLIRDLTPSTLH